MRIIPTRIHGILDYVVAIILLLVPWLLNFDGQNAATYVLVTLGLTTILYSLITDYEWGPVKVLSMPTHLMLDMASGVILATSPWIFSFSDYIYMPHLLLGILEVIVSLMTKAVPYINREDQGIMER